MADVVEIDFTKEDPVLTPRQALEELLQALSDARVSDTLWQDRIQNESELTKSRWNIYAQAHKQARRALGKE